MCFKFVEASFYQRPDILPVFALSQLLSSCFCNLAATFFVSILASYLGKKTGSHAPAKPEEKWKSNKTVQIRPRKITMMKLLILQQKFWMPRYRNHFFASNLHTPAVACFVIARVLNARGIISLFLLSSWHEGSNCSSRSET